MKNIKELIIEKTIELNELINSHAVTIDYKKLHNDLQHDKKSQELWARLVLVGQETTEKINRGETPGSEETWEHINLKQELDKNELVKKYILAQKGYLDLITAVTSQIKNPK